MQPKVPGRTDEVPMSLIGTKRRSMRAGECLFLVEKPSCGHHRKDRF